MKFEIIFIF